MIRRYLIALPRCLALAGLAAVGEVVAMAGLLLVSLVVTYPLIAVAVRRLAILGRVLSRDWGGVAIAADYRPDPPAPQRREDGWYQHDNQLFRSPRVPAFLAKTKALAEDSAITRDWLWLALTPFVGGVVVVVPLAMVIAGVIAPWLGRPAIFLPVGLLLVLGGLALGPSALRAHALWSRVPLQPKADSWWHRSGLGPWIGRTTAATWHGGALAGMSLGAIGFLVLQLVTMVVSWAGLLPWAAQVTRPYLNEYRRRAREWAAGDGIDGAAVKAAWAVPYRSLPDPPEREAGGRYRVGRTLHSSRSAALRGQQFGWVLKDPATWRDLLWMAASPPINVLGLIPAALLAFALFGLVLQPVGWAPWAVPIGLLTGHWVTPWYVWAAVTYLVPGLAVIPGWASPLVGLAIVAVALPLALPMLRLRAVWDRMLLGPTGAGLLTQRVQRLTESRADAADAQAAELRRIERDLHDGAQARLVAVGLSLGTVEQLMESDPAAAKALLAHARESSATALAELRNLVRGIHPPVLAERGLADAVRALALDSPIPIDVTVDLPGRPEPPVESAAYFAISEALANAIRHASARRIDIEIRYDAGALRTTVKDDGQGGADPAGGSGLRGVQRRLGTFDGALTVRSPRGGPTVVTMEIPCALSSPRTSTS